VKRGFTILELLIASILLGMLMTILTMIFTQSSVAWRLGASSVMNLNEYRNRKGYYNEKSDVTFVYGERVCEILSPFDDGLSGGRTSSLRTDRPLKMSGEDVFRDAAEHGCGTVSSLSADASVKSDAYTVNVMSGGPNNDVMDWEAIWSYPDDFE